KATTPSRPGTKSDIRFSRPPCAPIVWGGVNLPAGSARARRAGACYTPGMQPPDAAELRRRLAEQRRAYADRGLDVGDLAGDPYEQLRRWLGEAVAAGLPEPNAMVLATADGTGAPSARTVLLKGLDEEGLVFYT